MKADRLIASIPVAHACAGLILAGGLLMNGVVRADGEGTAAADVKTAISADPDNAVRTLKAGEAAQKRRWDTQMQALDADTRARVNGHTDDASGLRERGAAAKHVRDDVKRREKFDEMLRDDAPRAAGRAPTRRNLHGREVIEIPQDGTTAAAELERRGDMARRVRMQDAEISGKADVNKAMAADPDRAIKTLKAGEAAQQRRWDAQMRELDPETQARLNGETDDAKPLRERGAAAKHVREDVKRRDQFDEMLRDDAPRHQGRQAAARGDVERLAHEPERLDQLQRAGDRAQVDRGRAGRDVTDLAQGRAQASAELERRGEIARRQRGIDADLPAARSHTSPDTPSARAAHGRVGAGRIARGVAGGMAVGWAADTALGTHVPDPLDAAKWTGDTLQRPNEMPRRVGELATGAVQFTGQVATQLTRPDQMAVNLGKGAVGLAKYGAHMATHPVEAVNTVGNTVVGTGTAVVGVGVGLAKGAATVVNTGVRAIVPPKVARSPVVKAVTAPVRAVGKIFKPSKKSNKKKTNANCQMGFLFGSIRPGC